MTDRKKPGVTFWATVALVGYPLSLGPVEWLVLNAGVGGKIGNAIRFFYWPIYWADHNGPEPIHRALDWYVKLWR
jgi:hypothetical protein